MRTGPAAAVLGVSWKTIGRMIDRGDLEGGRIPGSTTHRWVSPADLVRQALAANRRAFIPPELYRFLPEEMPPDEAQLPAGSG